MSGMPRKFRALRSVAVCDVYQPALERAEAQAKKLGFAGVKARKDFREILADKSIDAVCISTPDHWHAYMTVEACKAGKDVYVEKPACVYVEEGVKMVQAARKYNRVVQAGTMQRSGAFFQKAREIVKSGALGDITFCRTFQAGLTKKEGWGNPPDSAPPPGLDWDHVAGTRAQAALQCQPLGRGGGPLVHVPLLLGLRRRRHDGLGRASARHRPVAFDEAMPVSIAAQGGKFYVDDNVETPDTMLATYRYPGFIASYESRTANPYPVYGDTYGTAFHGTKATLMVNRGGYTLLSNEKGAQPVEEHNKEMADMNVPHWKNFLECIRTRAKPISDIETCVRTTATCVLANLAMRHGMTLDWDEKAFTVKQHDAKQYLKAKYRSPWKLEV